MAGTTFTLIGAKQVKDRLKALNGRMEHAVMCALYEEAQTVRTNSMQLTPVDTGTLRGSHYATLPERIGEKVVTEIGVGGAAKGYAVHVHERFARHKVGQRKFLETALKEQAAGFAERFGRLARYHFERGSTAPKQVPGVPTDPGGGDDR